MQVAINSISLTGPFKAAGAKAADAEPLKSQLDIPSDAVQRPTDPNALVIFYIGDSITRHGFNQGTIAKLGWDHLAGMAATEESKDFAHLFAAHVQEANPGKKVSLFFHGKGTGAAAPRLANLGAYVPLKPDIVVVQLGEHEKQPTGPQKLRESYHDLLSTMQQWESKPLILCVGVWNPSGKGERTAYTDWTLQIDQIMGQVCQSLKIPYASMEKHALNPACSGWGTSGGVKWHPNDAGMQAYADELIAMYKAAHKP
jgi:lysophospholipase L1-like esterase